MGRSRARRKRKLTGEVVHELINLNSKGRFVDAAEKMLGVVLGQTLDDEPYLPTLLGPGVNPTFDGLLESLGRIAQRHTHAVINCVLEWRASSNESVPSSVIRKYL